MGNYPRFKVTMCAIFAFLVITSSLALTIANPEEDFTQLFPDVQLCSRQYIWTPFIEQCVQLSIETIKKYLANGIVQLGIPSLKSYYIKSYQFNLTDRFEGSLKFTNTWIKDLTNFKIYSINTSKYFDQIKIDVYFPIIQVDGQHDIQGIFWNLPVNNIGYGIHAIFEKIKANITISGEYFLNHEKQEFFQVLNVVVKLDIKDNQNNIINFDRENNVLYRASKLLDFWTAIGSEMLPKIEMYASNLILEIANKFYSKFPMTTLLPK